MKKTPRSPRTSTLLPLRLFNVLTVHNLFMMDVITAPPHPHHVLLQALPYFTFFHHLHHPYHYPTDGPTLDLTVICEFLCAWVSERAWHIWLFFVLLLFGLVLVFGRLLGLGNPCGGSTNQAINHRDFGIWMRYGSARRRIGFGLLRWNGMVRDTCMDGWEVYRREPK